VPGTSYKVKLNGPADFAGGALTGLALTAQDAGIDDALDSDAMLMGGDPTIMFTAPAAGSQDLTLDFGFNPELGSISDTVFEDLNSNGIQDPGEPGVDGVVVELLDAAMNPILVDALGGALPSVTSGGGQYLFDNLAPGTYFVRFTPPAGFSLTLQNAGGDDSLDSDADPVSGKSDPISLSSGVDIVTVDAGITPSVVVDVVINVFDLAGNLIGSEPGWIFPGEVVELNLQAPPFNLEDDQYGVVEVVRTSDPSQAQIAGSCIDEPQDNPIVIPWNGFASQFNILTVRNSCATGGAASLALYDAEGVLQSTQALALNAMSQIDISLNAIEGFQADTVGTVKLTHAGDSCVSGYLARFKMGDVGSANEGAYDFQLNLPLSNATRGASFASYNTFQPSVNPSHAGNPVYNWLEIINLSDSEQVFTKNIYDVGGALVETESLAVPAQGRRDLQAGHENPGPNMVGVVEVIPGDLTAEYFARVMRYGTNAASYDFATASDVTDGFSDCQFASVSSGAGAENWLVISNLSDIEAVARVEITSGGSVVGGFPVDVPIGVTSTLTHC